MLVLNGVSAWIEVDGQELEQYGIEEDPEKNLVTCWIATQAGKHFSVAFRDDAPYKNHSLASFLTLDGTESDGMVLRPPTLLSKHQNDDKSRTVVQRDCVISQTSTRPFMFAKLELTDEDEYLDQASKHLGEIQVELFRCQPSDNVPWSSVSSVVGQSKVHERSKKAVSHCVSLGQETKTAMQYTCHFKYLDDGKPFATFIFKYRDYSLLQANGIIPRPEENRAPADVLDLTTDNDVKGEPASDDIDDIQALDDAIIAMQNKRASLLAKRSGTGGAPPAKRVKREKFVPTGEVIDLT